MKQDYFVYNGNKHYSGTEFKIAHTSPNTYPVAYFVWYDTEHDTVWYQMAYTNQRRGCSMKKFIEQIECITGKVADGFHPPIIKQLKDSQIPKLVVGWMWYIFLMLFSIILNGAILWWALISIVFFSWRKGVIKKEGYYVEF